MAIGGFVSERARAEFTAAYQAGMRTLPEPAATRDVPTGFGTVRVYRFGTGDGVPLVLLPGRAGTTVIWRPNLAALAEHHPVYCLDVLGEPGASDQTAPLGGGADQAAWLDAVIAALDVAKVHLVGYSFGGWLAANQAFRAPHRLASLTLLDPVNTFARFPLALLARTALASLPLIARWARPAFLRWISGGQPVDPDDPVAAVIDAGMRTYRMAVSTLAYPTDTQLRAIPVPVLALIAGRSVIHHPARAAARARRLLPHAQVQVWPRATHSIAGELPDAVNKEIDSFVTAVAP